MINSTIKKSTKVNAPKEKVWDALVNPQKIKIYLFGTNTTSEWKKGSEILFHGEYEGTPYLDKGIIEEIIENKVLSYSYYSSFSPLEDKPENYSFVKFSLSGNKTKTNLEMEMSKFQSQVSMQHASSTWDQVLTMLKNLVEKEYLSISEN